MQDITTPNSVDPNKRFELKYFDLKSILSKMKIGEIQHIDLSNTAVNDYTRTPLSVHLTLFTEPVTSLAILSDNTVALGYGGKNGPGIIQIWDMKTQKCVKTLQDKEKGHTTEIYSLVELPNHILASGAAGGGVCLWDIKKGGHLDSNPPGHKGSVLGMVVLPNGRLVTTCVAETKLRIWHTRGLTVDNAPTQITFDEYDLGDKIANVILLDDGKTLAVSFVDGNSKSGHIYLWNSETQTVVRDISAHDPMYAGYAMAVFPTGELASALNSPEIKIWSTSSDTFGNCLNTLKNSAILTGALLVTPDGTLIRGASDGTLHFWDTQNHKIINTSKENHDSSYNHNAIGVLNDGTIISASDGAQKVNLHKFLQRPLEFKDIEPILLTLTIKSNTSVKSLSLRGITLSNQDVDKLIAVLKENKSLISLDIRNTNMTKAGTRKIVKAIKKHPTLCIIELSDDGLFPHLTLQERESLHLKLAKNRRTLLEAPLIETKFPKLKEIQISSNSYIDCYKQVTEKWKKAALEFNGIKAELYAAIDYSISHFQFNVSASLNPFEFDIKVIQQTLENIKSSPVIDSVALVNFASYAQISLQSYATQTGAITRLISTKNPLETLSNLQTTLNKAAYAVGSLTVHTEKTELESVITNIGILSDDLKKIDKNQLVENMGELAAFAFGQVSKLVSIDLKDTPENIKSLLQKIGGSGFSLENLGMGLELLGPILNFSGISPRLVNQIATVGKSAIAIGTAIAQIAAGAAIAGPIGAIAGAVGAIFSIFSGPSKEEQMLEKMQQGFEGLSNQIQKSTEALAKLFCEGLNELAKGINKNFEALDKKLDAYHKRTEQRFDIIEKIIIKSHLETMKKLESLGKKIRSLIDEQKTGIQILNELKVSVEYLDDKLTALFEATAINEYKGFLTETESFLKNSISGKKFSYDEATICYTKLSVFGNTHSASDTFLENSSNIMPEKICDKVKSREHAACIKLLATYANHKNYSLCNFKFFSRVVQDYIQFVDTCVRLTAFSKETDRFQDFINDCLGELKSLKETGNGVKNFLLDLRRENVFFENLCKLYKEKIGRFLNKIKIEDSLDSEKNLKTELSEINTAYEILIIYLALAFNNDFSKNGAILNYLNKMVWTSEELKGFVDKRFFNEKNKIALCNAIYKYVSNEINGLNILIEKKVKKAKTMQQTEYTILDTVMGDIEAFEGKLKCLLVHAPKLNISQSSDLGEKLSVLINEKGFKFDIKKTKEKEITINFTGNASLIEKINVDIDLKLVELTEALKKDISNKGINTNEYTIKAPLGARKLTIEGKSTIESFNSICKLLGEIGKEYFDNISRSAATKVLFFKPEANNTINQILEKSTESTDTITCVVQ